MKYDRLYQVSGNRKQRREQIAKLGKRERDRRFDEYLLLAMLARPEGKR